MLCRTKLIELSYSFSDRNKRPTARGKPKENQTRISCKRLTNDNKQYRQQSE